jgi:hypothetical protein
MPKPLIALALLLAAALPARAEEAHFDFSIAGIKVGTMTMDSAQSGASYTATSRIDTAGIAGLLNFFFDGTSSGTVTDGGKVVPAKYRAKSKSPRALRDTEIDWKGGTPTRVSVEPPRSTAPEPSQQGGTLDPVSAGFRLFRRVPADEICDTTVVVFDGSRLSQLQLAKPVAEGNDFTCEGAYARVEGESMSMADLRTFPFRLVFRKAGDGEAEIARIEAPTNFGHAVLSRKN